METYVQFNLEKPLDTEVDRMILHIIATHPGSIYLVKFYKFIKQNFDESEHIFVTTFPNIPSTFATSEELDHVTHLIKYVNLNSQEDQRTLLEVSNQVSKIIIHSLFDVNWLNWIYNKESLLKKSIVILWGGDIYSFWLKKKKYTPVELISEFFKVNILLNVKGIASLLEEDYEFVKNHYITNANYYYVFYPNPVDYALLDEILLNDKNSEQVAKSRKIRILLGNSATATNNHFEALEAISKVKDIDFEIVCPLSYGDTQYANQVYSLGQKLFGEKFIPLTQFLNPKEYAKILASVDVAIFNNNRQQALGNILALLYLGKKVYIRDEIPSWKFFKRYGIEVYNVKEILETPGVKIFDFDEKVGKKNRDIIKKEFSEEKAVETWLRVFNE